MLSIEKQKQTMINLIKKDLLNIKTVVKNINNFNDKYSYKKLNNLEITINYFNPMVKILNEYGFYNISDYDLEYIISKLNELDMYQIKEVKDKIKEYNKLNNKIKKNLDKLIFISNKIDKLGELN